MQQFITPHLSPPDGKPYVPKSTPSNSSSPQKVKSSRSKKSDDFVNDDSEEEAVSEDEEFSGDNGPKKQKKNQYEQFGFFEYGMDETNADEADYL